MTEMSENFLEIPTIKEDSAELPKYTSASSAGADLKAHIEEDKVLLPGESALIPTGLKVQIPQGYEIQVRPRSGLALKHQITVLNTPGTIDPDFRGEIGVILINHGKNAFTISPGMRIAQLVVAPVFQGVFTLASELSETSRGAGGFGHTGYH